MLSRSLLYLLLLYAVLDKDKKLSLTTGLVIAFVIMLLTCYRRCYCNGVQNNLTNTTFGTLNNVL